MTNNAVKGKRTLSDRLNWLAGWVFSTDHKRIGVMYIIVSFVFFFVGGALAGMIRTQLSVPNSTAFDPTTYNGIYGIGYYPPTYGFGYSAGLIYSNYGSYSTYYTNPGHGYSGHYHHND